MLKNTPENGNGLPDKASSGRSHDFWNGREGDGLKHCIQGLRSAFYMGVALVIGWVGGHFLGDGKTENNKKGKMEIDAGQTQMSPQAPRHEDFFKRDPKFLE